ncbi:MAG: HNH endonuclease [Clostridia bacterium]|jgi:5-methylcytosine-specific restriction protein A|nr:HNH endonuclease [Clostridia bacterium]
MREFAKNFYKSKAWLECRQAFIDSLPDKTCNRCKERPGKIVHHKIELEPSNIDNAYITLNFENLEYVCQDCHNKEHNSSNQYTKEDVKFDSDGNLIKNIPPQK